MGVYTDQYFVKGFSDKNNFWKSSIFLYSILVVYPGWYNKLKLREISLRHILICYLHALQKFDIDRVYSIKISLWEYIRTFIGNTSTEFYIIPWITKIKFIPINVINEICIVTVYNWYTRPSTRRDRENFCFVRLFKNRQRFC